MLMSWCVSARISQSPVWTISAAWTSSKNICQRFSAATWTWSKSRCAKSAFKKRSTGTAPLPSEKPVRRLEDIIENAQAILRYTAGMDLTAFEEDSKTYDAVE